MTIRSHISKEEVNLMPRVDYDRPIYVIDTPEAAEQAVETLKACGLVGIDTETRPSFQRGELHKVALLQLATDHCCYLFRLNIMGLTPALVGLLESEETIKVGLSLRDDFLMLRKRAPFTPRGVVELQNMAQSLGIEDMSLQKIYALLFGEKISKTQRLTNWEADTLTVAQQKYAGLDAWACLRIYRRLREMEAAKPLTT